MYSYKYLSLVILSASIMSILIIPSYGQESDEIPSWIKGTVGLWVDGTLNDSEFKSAMEFLIENGIIQIENPFRMSEENVSTELTAATSYADELNAEKAELEKTIREMEIKLEEYPDEETQKLLEEEIEDWRAKWQVEYKEKSDLEEKISTLESQNQSLKNEITYLNEQLEN